jgi:hypothetical protein
MPTNSLLLGPARIGVAGPHHVPNPKGVPFLTHRFCKRFLRQMSVRDLRIRNVAFSTVREHAGFASGALFLCGLRIGNITFQSTRKTPS